MFRRLVCRDLVMNPKSNPDTIFSAPIDKIGDFTFD
ncbi:carboxy-S-adenosyl-L-methionine synthase CmoA, partial [Vibrio sp. Vb1574]|nr:carboxy-S-adenosyl-L-methionine synthase CmoA [Vibrio sp. Vb1574]